MPKFTPTRRGNDCPICGDISGDCRHGDGFILCHSFIDQNALVAGWKYVKPSQAGIWGIYVPDDGTTNGKSWQDVIDDRLRRRREKEQRRKAALEKAIGKPLSLAERTAQYQLLVNQIPLDSDHRSHLKNRGLSAAEIEKGLFRSVSPGGTVTGVSPRLPGIGRDGTSIWVSDRGFIIPVFDLEGNAIAFQLRLDNVVDSKYRWLKSLYSSHLPNGEMPITCCRPVGRGEPPEGVIHPKGEPLRAIAHTYPLLRGCANAPTSIGLAEGILKPYIAAQKWGCVIIGAAGGNFVSSPLQLQQYLDALSVELVTKLIVLYPDGGAIFNRHIMGQYQRTIELIASWGYEVQIAWWGQLTKDDCDIDELDSCQAIQYISPDEFWEISRTAIAVADTAEKERQERLKAEAEAAIYKSLTEIDELPWQEVNTPKLELDNLIEPGAIYIVSSAKGTHKTNSLKSLIPQFDACYSWFSRIALGREECHRLNLIWKTENLAYRNKSKRGFCSDSAPQFDPKVLAYKGLLIVDECDQVFEHNFGDTCNKDGKRPIILATLEAHINAAIAGGGAVIFLSADVSQKEIDYIKALAPNDCPVRLILNHYQPEKCDCYFDESEFPDAQIEDLLQTLEDGIPCFVIDDIKKGIRGCKSIAEYIRTIHPDWSDEIVEINSDTSGEPEIIKFLQTINQASLNKRLICCSPSVVSGISIENGRFIEGVFGFFNGILPVNQASQALSRVRGALVVRIWTAKKGIVFAANRANDPKEISNYYHKNYEKNAQHILGFGVQYNPLTNEWNSPHWKLYCQNAAYRNLCMEKLRDRLRAKLEKEGYHLIPITSSGSDMAYQGCKQAWSKIELDYALAVAQSPVMNDAQLEELQYSSEPLSPEEKLSYEKTMLLKWFGEELINATTFNHKKTGTILTGYAAMYLKNERGLYRQRLENFYLLMASVEEAIAKDIAVEYRQLKHGYGCFPGDLRWRTRQRKAREFLGLLEFLNPKIWTTPKDYKNLGEKAKKFAILIKDVLNLSVEKLSDSQIYTELMQQLGLELEKEWVNNPTAKRRYKKRRITAESWDYAQMYVAYRQFLKAEAQVHESAASTIHAQTTQEPVATVQEVTASNSATSLQVAAVAIEQPAMESAVVVEPAVSTQESAATVAPIASHHPPNLNSSTPLHPNSLIGRLVKDCDTGWITRIIGYGWGAWWTEPIPKTVRGWIEGWQNGWAVSEADLRVGNYTLLNCT